MSLIGVSCIVIGVLLGTMSSIMFRFNAKEKQRRQFALKFYLIAMVFFTVGIGIVFYDLHSVISHARM